MKFVEPGDLTAGRAYFTEFDRVTYSQVAWNVEDVATIRMNVERKFKLVALTKGHVVIAASHLLESELAHEILLAHPQLFSKGLIVPALRSEFPDFRQFLETKLAEGKESAQYIGDDRREMAQVLDAHVDIAVKWNTVETSRWFHERLIHEMVEPSSLLNCCARAAGARIDEHLIAKVRDLSLPSRQDVYLLAKGTGDLVVWQTVCDYVDFLYYLGGARAVAAEGVLPQENLLDFSLSDLAGGRTQLSEMQVFFKLYIDLVKVATQTHFPVDVLDALSLDDVLDLHAIAVEDGFVEKYNAIQERTKVGLLTTA